MKVTVGRTFRLRDYESYTVTFHEVEVEDGKEHGLLTAEIGEWCLAARDRYLEVEAEWNSPDFHPASDLPRQQEAEQGSTRRADSPTPAPTGAGASAGAEEPDAPPATSDMITDFQLAALQDRLERDVNGRVKTHIERRLKSFNVDRLEELTKQRAQDLLKSINDRLFE